MTTKQRQAAAVTAGARFVPVVEWHYSMATISAANKIGAGTVAERSHRIGMRQGEPLVLAMDAALQYASSYTAHFERRLADDYVLGPNWLEWVRGLRGLLNGDGAIAMVMDRRTDSKDNGAVEQVFWAAMELAGYTEKDL